MGFRTVDDSMNTSDVKDRDEAVVKNELVAKELAAIDEKFSRDLAAIRVANAGEAAGDQVRLPKRIAGGFKGLAEDLEKRGRDWTTTVRLLDQHRIVLEAAEQERGVLYEQLSRNVVEAQDSGRSLKATLDACKSGDISGDLAGQFARNARALADLEKTSAALGANLVWFQSLWEQYARMIVKAQRQREDVRTNGL